MNKITLALLLFMATLANAQQVYIGGGKSSTKFEYKNSQGISLDNLQAASRSFMTAGYRNQLLTKNLHLNLGANYASYGAIGSDATLGNYMAWDVNYAGLDVGLDYHLFHIQSASIYVKTGMSAGLFIQGTQTLNNRVIDLKNNEDFGSMLSMQVGAGFSHPISEHLSFYTQYLYGKSANMSKGDAELKIESSNVSFGLLVHLSKKKTSHRKRKKNISRELEKLNETVRNDGSNLIF
jgi:hypothetical protein